MKRYARKKRQLSYLVKKINRLEQAGWSGVSGQAKLKLVSKANQLFNILKYKLGQRSLRKAMAVLGIVGAMLSPNLMNAQVTQYAEPVVDTFGLESISVFQIESFVDIDNDGDLDKLAIGYDNVADTGSHFYFSENIGDVNNPDFAEAILDTFNLQLPLTIFGDFTTVDIDGDGDLDLLGAHYVDVNTPEQRYGIAFYENIGNVDSPDFAEPVVDPFDIAMSSEERYIFGISHADLDGDGDYDLMITEYFYMDYEEFSTLSYLENIGDTQNPSFPEEVRSAFDLPQFMVDSITLIAGKFVDFDVDGDQDIIATSYFPNQDLGLISYFQNIGDSENPAFAPVEFNPAGLNNEINTFSASFADLDGDNDLDAIATPFDPFEGVQYFENLYNVVGLTDISSQFDISLSPNPAQDFVTINIEGHEGELKNLQVFNLVGRSLLSREISNSQFNLDISSLEQGQYFVVFRNEEGIVTKKLIVK